MSNCKDCKWWDGEPLKCAPEGWSLCNRNYEDGNLMGPCGHDHFITAPNFGCVLFEAK